jgi:hypothetical protein
MSEKEIIPNAFGPFGPITNYQLPITPYRLPLTHYQCLWAFRPFCPMPHAPCPMPYAQAYLIEQYVKLLILVHDRDNFLLPGRGDVLYS